MQSGTAVAGQILFVHPQKNYVIVQLKKKERRSPPAELCFFTPGETQVGCGEVVRLRKGKAVVAVGEDFKRELAAGMAARSRKSVTALPPEPAGVHDLSVETGLRYQHFPHEPSIAGQQKANAALVLQPRYRHKSPDGRRFINMHLYGSYEQSMAEESDDRLLADIREMDWTAVGENAELRIGFRKVFWGVAESNHVVDVINQTDFAASPDGEEKLGQPMINFAWIESFGVLDVYLMPVFRPRTFNDHPWRFQAGLSVSEEDALYQSSQKSNSTDWAMRYSLSFNSVDAAVSWFQGTNREPRLTLSSDDSGRPGLIPYYSYMYQSGLELQYLEDGLALKFELMNRNEPPESFRRGVLGFEYSFNGVAGSAKDLGILAEYSRDSRLGQSQTFLQDDLFFGVRVMFNDTAGSELLTGGFHDFSSKSRMILLEGSRRLGDSVRFSVSGHGFSGLKEYDAAWAFRKDSYLQTQLTIFW